MKNGRPTTYTTRTTPRDARYPHPPPPLPALHLHNGLDVVVVVHHTQLDGPGHTQDGEHGANGLGVGMG